MNTKKLSYPKPLPSARLPHHPPAMHLAAGSSGGWMVIFGVAVGFLAMIMFVLASGKA